MEDNVYDRLKILTRERNITWQRSWDKLIYDMLKDAFKIETNKKK